MVDSREYFFDVPGVRPEPTSLYSILPTDLGTGGAESITGYVSRLAREHRVSTYRLVEDVIFPTIDDLASANFSTRRFRTLRWPHLAGVGPASKAWVEALCKLTGREDLGLCTLQWVIPAISSHGLVCGRMRYCPTCLAEDIEINRPPHDRLLWQVDAVKACPLHGVRLREKQSKCKESGGAKRSRGFLRFLQSGYCTDCGKVAYRCDPLPPEIASVEELWVAEQVYELIAFGTAGNELSRTKLAGGIERLASQAFSGSLSSLAQRCNLSKSQIWEWIHEERSKPSLPSLLQLSSSAGCGLTSLLLGTPDLRAGVPFVRLCQRKRNPVDYRLAESLLKTAIGNLDGSRSLKDIATIAGAASEKSLTSAFPELARQVVALHQAATKRQRELRHESARLEAEKVLQELARRNLSPTLRNVQTVLGVRWSLNSTIARAFMNVRPPFKPRRRT